MNSNAAVILTNDGVVVVDSHSKPSAAQALYREIQGITKQPIRKVINTHFHWDHWQGNQAYAAASPNLEIITSERTKDNLTKPDAGVGGLSYVEKQLAAVPKEIEPDFSDTWFQRAFMDISGRYPVKALHTQGVKHTHPPWVGICSAGDSFARRFGNASHDVGRRTHAGGGQAPLPGGHHGPLLLALHLHQRGFGLG